MAAASQASLPMFEGMVGVLMPGRKVFDTHQYDDADYACNFQMRAPLEEIIIPLPAEDAHCPGSSSVNSDVDVVAEVPASVNESLLHEGSSWRFKLGVCNRHEMCGWAGGHYNRPTQFGESLEVGAPYHPASGGDETLSSGKKVSQGGLHGRPSLTGSQENLGSFDSRQEHSLVDQIPAKTIAVDPEADVAHENNRVRVKDDDIFGPRRGHSYFRSDVSGNEEEASETKKSNETTTLHQHGEYAVVLEDYIPLNIHGDAGMSQQSLSEQLCSKRRKHTSVLNSALDHQFKDKNIGHAGVLECPAHQETKNDRLLGESKFTQVDEASVATLPRDLLQQQGFQQCENGLSMQTEGGRNISGKQFRRSMESFLKQDPGNSADLDIIESVVRESLPLASTSSRGKLPGVVEEDSIEQEMIKEEALKETPLSMGEEPASASNRKRLGVDVDHSLSQHSHSSSPLVSGREGKEPSGISVRAKEPIMLRSRAAGLPPDVGIVVIEDDEDEEEDEDDEDGEGDACDSYDDTDSDAGSKRHPFQCDPVSVSRPAVPASRQTSNIIPEFSSSEDDSDSDDCQVLSWHPAQKKTCVTLTHSIWREREPNAKLYSPESSQCTGGKKQSSDIEIMQGSQGILRQQWEEAALNRRMGRVMQSEGSKAGRNSRRGQPSNLGRWNSANSAPGTKEQGASRPAQQARDTHQHGLMASQGLAESVATSTDSDDQIGIESRAREEGGVDVVPCASSYKEQLPDIVASSAGSDQLHQVFPSSPRGLQEAPVQIATLFPGQPSGGDLVEESDDQYLQGEPCGCMQNCFKERVTSHRIDGFCTSRQDDFNGMTDGGLVPPKVIPDLNIREGMEVEIKPEALTGSDIIGEREKMKQSIEFQRADKDEWARRDLERERQAQEAQKLLKRKRAEKNRKMEMENRQKQRLEEVRLLQQEEERNMGLKEQLRGQVQKRLETLASGCSDMATLLRHLGIAVEGGPYPSPQEVNSAYKKALLRFHPDRASALVQGDPQGQVEAEETFKLISRMKNTLSLVSTPTFNSFW